MNLQSIGLHKLDDAIGKGTLIVTKHGYLSGILIKNGDRYFIRNSESGFDSDISEALMSQEIKVFYKPA